MYNTGTFIVAMNSSTRHTYYRFQLLLSIVLATKSPTVYAYTAYMFVPSLLLNSIMAWVYINWSFIRTAFTSTYLSTWSVSRLDLVYNVHVWNVDRNLKGIVIVNWYAHISMPVCTDTLNWIELFISVKTYKNISNKNIAVTETATHRHDVCS